MTEPNGILDDGINPTIGLAGKKWPIPLLAPRQNRWVVPAVAHITKRMRELAEAKLANLSAHQRDTILANASPQDVERLGPEGAVRLHVWSSSNFAEELITVIDSDFFDVLTAAVFWALKRAHPQMSREEFDDMPIATLEMIDSIAIIAMQTGMMRKAGPSAAPLAPAGSQSPSSPTGTS